MEKLFTSESVSPGHPDKMCDQISDGILDKFLEQDKSSHVACESFISQNNLIIGGEIKSNAKVNIEEVAKNVIKDIGYDNVAYGLDYNSMNIFSMLHKQSNDIDMGVSGKEEQGAGDQGMMFGFACKETPELMPMPIVLAHKLMKEATHYRKSYHTCFGPDAKSQVTIKYDGNKPVHIDTVVISQQHDEDVELSDLKAIVKQNVIEPVLNGYDIYDDKTKILINPTGRFVLGGPVGDTGLTGRKIIVDTYGGMGRHGGGCFSGKDPSKVDRSAAYMARYIAKNIVAADLAERCEIQLAYAIGVAEPVSIRCDTFGTGVMNDDLIAEAVRKTFDCTPAGIIKKLDLLNPIYLPTATFGHFGNPNYNWEKLDMKQTLLDNI